MVRRSAAGSGRCRGEAGATLVEYGLMVSLVVVVLLGALQRVTDDSSEELEERADRSGAPDLAATGASPPPGGGGGGPIDPGPGPTSPAITVRITRPTGCWEGGTKNWTASFVVVVIEDATSEPVSEAIVSARLRRIHIDGSTEVEVIEPSPRETLPDGTAHFAAVGLSMETGNPAERTGSVVFELTGISGIDPPVNYSLPDPPPSILVDRTQSSGACT